MVLALLTAIIIVGLVVAASRPNRVVASVGYLLLICGLVGLLVLSVRPLTAGTVLFLGGLGLGWWEEQRGRSFWVLVPASVLASVTAFLAVEVLFQLISTARHPTTYSLVTASIRNALYPEQLGILLAILVSLVSGLFIGRVLPGAKAPASRPG